MSVKLRHGSPTMIDYTPSSDVTAGDIVVAGGLNLVAHHDCASGVKGSMAVRGGVYEARAAAIIAIGTVVYWDPAGGSPAGEMTATAGSLKRFGYAVETTVEDGNHLFLHDPA